MFPARFDYRRATSVDDALDALTDDPDRDVRVLAGGHGLLPAMKTEGLAPDVLVDVSDCDALRGIELATDSDEDGGYLSIGPLTTHAELAASDRVAASAPALAEAARAVGDAQIRNRGTIGGNLVEADPEADLPAAIVATGATIRLRGPAGEREVAAVDFFGGREGRAQRAPRTGERGAKRPAGGARFERSENRENASGETASREGRAQRAPRTGERGAKRPAGGGETAVRDDELVTEIRVPAAASGAYVRRTHPARGFAMVGVAAVVDVADAAVTAARIGAVGATDRPVRLSAVEDSLAGIAVDEDAGTPVDTGAIRAAAERATRDIEDEPRHDDVHASGEFRASVLDTYVERAIERAIATEVSDD